MRNKKNKVLFFHPMNDFTGSTRVLATVIADEFRGQEVTIMSNFKNTGCLSSLQNVNRISFWAPEFKHKYIPVITTLASRIHLFLLTLFYGWQYDIFYINTFKPEYAAIVGCLYGKQIIYHIHEKYVNPNLGQRFSEFVFNHTRAKKIYVSEYLRKQYPQYPGSDYIVKYNKLSKDFLSGVRIKPQEERKKNTIIFIGSLGLIKGVDKILPLAKSLPCYVFEIILSAEMEDIRNYFGEDIPLNLHLYSKQSDVRPYLERADLLINLSNPDYWIETFGMTVLEAMVYGIPSIVPNVGGPKELVINGYNGFCVDTTNIDDIRMAIIKALSNDVYPKLCENTLKQYENFK